MSTVPYRKVNREQILEEVIRLIQESKEGEVEISSSELADRFDIQGPTMDYHLNKLIEEGRLDISPNRGRYNRKIYRLPSQMKNEKPTANIITPESSEKFYEFLKQHISKQEAPQQKEAIQEQEKEIKQELEQKPLTLDERIQKFLEQSKQVHEAESLLKHEDKEILSVMNETIHQTQVYLKDLSEQLTTVQSKELIQGLIDDRNRMQSQIERLEEELKEARNQVNQTIEKYDIDPDRVRFMHQMLISTIDEYINLPNHAMALGRTEYREKMSKEVGDLVKYVLRLEE